MNHELVEQYVPYAEKLAFQKKRTLPKFIDIEDLKSAAYMGLVEAASRFDRNAGIAFSTYAFPRISGAICDFLRSQSWMRQKESKMLSLENEDYSVDVESKTEYKVEELFDHITVKMDKQAKQILKHYFIDEQSMKEVGDRFGISESRVCQLIKQYKTRIREDHPVLELAA